MQTMTHRERLLATLRRQPVDRVPDYEFGAWVQTIERWNSEGLPNRVIHPWSVLERYFGTDDADFGPGLGINLSLLPAFEPQVLEDRGDSEIVRDSSGATCEQLKASLGASIPRYLRYAIESRRDWVQMRDERLNPDHPDRLPRYLDALARRLEHADYPVVVSAGSLYGWIRNWMGVERLSVTLYDDPAWIEEMMEHLTQLTLHVLGKLAGKVRVIDRADWWEDMCFNKGPLLSPRLFTRLMVPRYQRITRFLREAFGTEFNQLDCDGNIHALTPLWLEGGINVMFPIEVAHTNALRLIEQNGPAMLLRGAVDKRALIAGPAAIDVEMARLRPLLARGGLIPHTDHLVPPDVSFENYVYYRRKKCELIGKPWREPGFQARPGHIVDWRLIGPFDNTANAGFHTPLPVEAQRSAGGPYVGKHDHPVSWQAYRGEPGSSYVDLAATLSREPWCVAYAACEVHAPGECDAWLELGSDDGIEVWLNGEEVWCRDAYRWAWAGQDRLPVHLRAGTNAMLLKVGQAEGEWGFHCRIVGEDGAPLERLATTA